MKGYWFYIFVHLFLFLFFYSQYSKAVCYDSIVRNSGTKVKLEQFDSLGSKGTKLIQHDSLKRKSGQEFTNNFRLDFFTSLLGSYWKNPPMRNGDNNYVYLYYNLNISNQFTSRSLAINILCTNELGFKKYLDSIHVKPEDLYTLRIDLCKTIKKNLSISISDQVKTQLWNDWIYTTDTSLHLQRQLYSSYFSPGYYMYNAGLSLRFWKSSRFDLGLVGGQITRMRNQEIYSSRNETVLYGVQQGKRKQTAFGISLRVNIPPHCIRKFLYWENAGRLFIHSEHLTDYSTYQLEMTTGIHVLFLRYLRIGIRTKLNYDPAIDSRISVGHILLFGFYLSNHL